MAFRVGCDVDRDEEGGCLRRLLWALGVEMVSLGLFLLWWNI